MRGWRLQLHFFTPTGRAKTEKSWESQSPCGQRTAPGWTTGRESSHFWFYMVLLTVQSLALLSHPLMHSYHRHNAFSLLFLLAISFSYPHLFNPCCSVALIPDLQKSTTFFFICSDSSSTFLATTPLFCLLSNLARFCNHKVTRFCQSWETKALNLLAIWPLPAARPLQSMPETQPLFFYSLFHCLLNPLGQCRKVLHPHFLVLKGYIQQDAEPVPLPMETLGSWFEVTSFSTVA